MDAHMFQYSSLSPNAKVAIATSEKLLGNFLGRSFVEKSIEQSIKKEAPQLVKNFFNSLNTSSKKDWATDDLMSISISDELRKSLSASLPFETNVTEVSTPQLLSVWLVSGPEPKVSSSNPSALKAASSAFKCLYSHGHCFIAPSEEFDLHIIPGVHSALPLYERLLLHSNRGVRLYAEVIVPTTLATKTIGASNSQPSARGRAAGPVMRAAGKGVSSDVPQTRYLPMTLELPLLLEVDERTADVSAESFTEALFGAGDLRSDSKKFAKERARISTGRVGGMGSDPVAMKRAIEGSIKQSYDQFADYSHAYHSQGGSDDAEVSANGNTWKRSKEGRIFPKGRGLLQVLKNTDDAAKASSTNWKIASMMGEGKIVTHPLVTDGKVEDGEVRGAETLAPWRADPIFV